tara:strand:- start:182 stop:349 length:168 start_codon:yes stop_codon:yes gene_type:complete
MIAGNKLHDAFLLSVILPTITFSPFHIGGAGMTRLVSDNNSLAVFVTQDSCDNGL